MDSLMDCQDASQKSCLLWEDDIGSDQRIYGFENLCEFPANYLKDVCSIAKRANGGGFSHFTVLAGRLSFKLGNIGSGGGWHRDSPHKNQVKIISYLSDVEFKNGPFEYVRGSNSFANRMQVDGLFSSNRRYQAEDIENDQKIEIITGEQGASIVVDTKGIHRGKPIQKGRRYALTFYFFENGKVSPALLELINGNLSVFKL